MFGRLTKARIEAEFDLPVFWVKTLKEAVTLLDMPKSNFSMALLDFNLPDAPHGEVIDEVIKRGISTLVFTSNMSDEVREQVWEKKVADYILKDDPNSLEYIISAMKRLEQNSDSLILVVDDSSTYRNIIAELLYIHKYRVITARNGESALQIIDKHPEIQLVITDFNMPGMNGCLLCQHIRKQYKFDDLAIIGISSENDKSIGARFIKSGANDFIIKHSFIVEEFYCRIHQCLDNIHLIQQTKEAAIKDFLTGLYNRRYFFHAGAMLISSGKRDQIKLACAMIDIDFFKKVNDTHGHDVGDIVICKVADLIQARMRTTDIVARIGGEEFCVLAVNMGNKDAESIFQELRQTIADTIITFNNKEDSLQVSVSIGVCTTAEERLEDMVKKADELLYLAKNNGRNCIKCG